MKLVARRHVCELTSDQITAFLEAVASLVGFAGFTPWSCQP